MYPAVVIQDLPFAYYRLAESSASPGAADSAGQQRPGVYGGSGITYSQTNPLRETPGGRGVLLSGSTPALVATSWVSDPFKTASGFAIELWFKPASLSSSAVALCGNNNPSTLHTGVGITATNTALAFLVGTGSSALTVSYSVALQTTQWYHIAATFDGSAVGQLYLNGVQVASTVSVGTYSGSGIGSFAIGSNGIGGQFTNGTFSEVAIYTQVLSAVRVKTHYIAGVGQAGVPYFAYGSYCLHDGYNYFLEQKQPSMPSYQQSLYPIARGVGVKKTGERQNEVSIPVSITVVSQLGTLADLERLLDILYEGLSLRQQTLVIQSNDGRYWVADATVANATWVPGKIVAIQVQVTFVAKAAFAYAGLNATYTYGPTALTSVAGPSFSWSTGTIVFSGGGNAASFPSIAITLGTTVTIEAVALFQSTDGVEVALSGLTMVSGNTLNVLCDPYAASGNSYNVNLNSGAPLAFSGVLPVLQPTLTVWSLSVQTVTNVQPTLTIVWSWTPRWLS